MDEAVIERLKGSVSDRSKRDRVEVGKAAGDGALIDGRDGDIAVSEAVISVVVGGRELDEPFSVEGQKDFAAGHVFEAAVSMTIV